MNFSEQTKKVFENKYLKQIYPELSQRLKYVQKKLSNCSLQVPVILRIQPHPKTTLRHIFITLVMENKTSLAQVTGHLHKRILKLDQKSSLFLFSSKKIVNNNWKVGDMYKNCKDQDGIIYIQYSHDDPF